MQLELTQFQRRWLIAHRPKARVWLRQIILTSLVAAITFVFFCYHYEQSVPAWAGNMAGFSIWLYIAFNIFVTAVGFVGRFAIWLAQAVSKFRLEIEKDGEAWKMQDDKDKNIEKVFAAMAKGFPLLSPIRWYFLRGVDILMDLTLGIVLIGAGWHFAAVCHLTSIAATNWHAFVLRKKLIAYVRTRAPDAEEQENIDQLADRLFHDTDQL